MAVCDASQVEGWRTLCIEKSVCTGLKCGYSLGTSPPLEYRLFLLLCFPFPYLNFMNGEWHFFDCIV